MRATLLLLGSTFILNISSTSMQKWRTEEGSHRIHIHHKVAFTQNKKYTNIPHYYACVFHQTEAHSTHFIPFDFRFSFHQMPLIESTHTFPATIKFRFVSVSMQYYGVLTCRLFSLQLFRIWYAKWFFNISQKSFGCRFVVGDGRCIDYKLTSIAISPFFNVIALHALLFDLMFV